MILYTSGINYYNVWCGDDQQVLCMYDTIFLNLLVSMIDCNYYTSMAGWKA